MQFPSGSTAQRPASPSTPQKKRVRPRFVPGEVLVRYRSESIAQNRTGRNVVAAQTGELMQADVERRQGSELVPGLRVVHVAAGDTLKTVAALRSQPEVLYAEPNYILHADATPNDPLFLDNRQYALQKISAQQAWDTTTGSSNIVVGVIDQGIDNTHQDLAQNMWQNPVDSTVNGVDDDANGFVDDVRGFNFVDNNFQIFSHTDAEAHATHVAGIIGARGNNGIGVTGVNWNVRLMSLKFLDADGFGDTADAIDACAYAKMMRDRWVTSGGTQGANVRVLNASFGGNAFSTAFKNAINNMIPSGILFVAAAGNVDDGTREPNNDLVPHFPSSFEASNMIAVASTDAADNLSDFSHFGRTSVHLAAPGDVVLSTTPPCSDPGPFPKPCDPSFPVGFTPTQDTYSFFSGTSMSAPQVSGAAALLLAQNPNLTLQQLKSLLIFNGDVVPGLVDKVFTGRRLNVGASMQSLLEADTTNPGPVTNLHLNSQNGRTFNLGWTAAGDDGAGGGAAKLYALSYHGTSGELIPLKGVIPVAPGTAQTTTVTLPYRHLDGTIEVVGFDNKGNQSSTVSVPVTVPGLNGDPYAITEGAAAPLSTGGNRINIDGDDRYVDFLLPGTFPFPFFGATFTELTISSNGNIFFSTPPQRLNLPPGNLEVADDPPGSPRTLGGYAMIAGLWEDLDLSDSARADAGVYVGTPDVNNVLQPVSASSTKIVFRWQGVPCNFDPNLGCQGGAPVNFEIELNKDGTVRTRYGTGNTGLFPTVGISGGDHDPYVITSHSSEESAISLSNAGQVTFAPLAAFTPATLSAANVDMKAWTIGGRTSVYVKLNFNDAGFSVLDWGNPTQSGTDFSVNTSVQRFNGSTVQAITNTAQIWDLGAIPAGNYTFTFKTSGATAKVLNFSVSAAPPPANPIDEAREFVRWQYKDFLRREPDGPGWDHWTGEITECTTDPTKRFPGETEAQCIERKRANTSAAFFLSPEFSNTGYFVLRVYRGSLNRMPHFGGGSGFRDEFTRDAVTVGQGIVVNDSLAPAVINANKQAFVQEFVTRLEFRAIYDGLNNTQYVDKLFQTTGVTPASNDRQALIDGLNGGSETRASVLFKVVDGTNTITDGALQFQTPYGKAFYDNLFNAAFVQMEYFGYLLRDPDDGGYNFWLGKLNQFGNWVDAQMVLAFIKSPEYRSRFGQP